ncbi:uncharacterized protein [Rutidosis leptorrhynchoides]|uniref:uncharacterized protein n=1 Tax=Rutidosis leptorrhynchoides TaxID=125765 RepID=UPI003A99CB9C
MNKALKREHDLQKKETIAEGKRKVKETPRSSQQFQSKKPRVRSNVCFRCGKPGHFANKCQSSDRTYFYYFKSGHVQAECPVRQENMRKEYQRNEMEKKVGTSIQKPQTRAFQITTEEAKEFHDVVSGTLIVNSMPAHVLFDSGATKSFVSLSFCEHFNVPLSKMDHPLEVEIADNKLVIVNDVYRGCNIEIDNEVFKIDLIPLQAREFHVIIGMDWLGRNRGVIKCHEKIFRLQSPSGKVITIYGERTRNTIPVLSYAKAKRLVSHGCQAFLAHVVDSSKVVRELKIILVVNEFPDVFPENLSGIPPDRQVEFRIDLMPGAAPIAKTPNRLAPTEMQEMMN